jgi:hypothetical protein
MKIKKILMFILAFGLLLTACSDPQLPPVSSSPSILPPGGAEPVPTELVSPGEAGQAPDHNPLRDISLVQVALTNLSTQLEIPADEIQVLAVEEVTWPDSSLGCGEPGSAYLQVLTPGYRVELGTERGQYVFHTDNKQTVILCKEGLVNKKSDSPGVIESGLEPFVNQAVADLVNRVGVKAEEILVQEAKSMVWPDAGLGCPQPGMSYKQVQEEGYLIQLVIGKQTYAYHGGGGQAPFLCEQ